MWEIYIKWYSSKSGFLGQAESVSGLPVTQPTGRQLLALLQGMSPGAPFLLCICTICAAKYTHG